MEMKNNHMQNNSSKENYLKAILQLQQKQGEVHAVDIAEYMDFSAPSISRAVAELRKFGYISVDENKVIALTDAGMEKAALVLQKYLFIRALLQAAGVEEPLMSEEACNMEHAISDSTFLALRQLLGGVVEMK